MTRPGILQDTHNRIIRDLRISITDRCNFHCVYCLPETEEAANFYRPNTLGPSKTRPANSNPIYPWKPRSQILTFEEITRVTRVAASLGINKVRITGGEPLLRKGVENLVSQIAAIDSIRDLSLTTNGTGFPALAKRLLRNTALVKERLADGGLPVSDSAFPVISLECPERKAAAALRRRLLANGIYPSCIRYPAANDGTSYRFALSSEHTRDQLQCLIAVLMG